MKLLLILLTTGIAYLIPATETTSTCEKKSSCAALSQPAQPLSGNISAVEFKNQKYCRAEADNFEFDVKFKIVSATAFFTGANFKQPEFRKITSNNLAPLKDLMDRCIPGTIVIFDDIKVLAPDNEVRTIRGVTYRLF